MKWFVFGFVCGVVVHELVDLFFEYQEDPDLFPIPPRNDLGARYAKVQFGQDWTPR